MDPVCDHLARARDIEPHTTEGCENCLAIGSRWVHLRLCLECGQVGCCDSSPNQHARHHVHETGHPVVRSLEPGETWAYCYEDDDMIERLPDANVDEASKDSFPTSDPPSW